MHDRRMKVPLTAKAFVLHTWNHRSIKAFVNGARIGKSIKLQEI